MASSRHIRDLIERIARINAADEWTQDLNPTQWAALSYLARANRFSRAPSQVAEFLAATRGTVSQTLKALARKGLIVEVRSALDKRRISYDVTDKGRHLFVRSTVIDEVIAQLPTEETLPLAQGLELLARRALRARDRRPFGQCKTCPHHRAEQGGAYCSLLNEPLRAKDVDLICYEHEDVL